MDPKPLGQCQEILLYINKPFNENFQMSYKNIDLSKKLQVAFNAGCGLSTRENAERSNISKSSVSRILQIMRDGEKPNYKIDFLSQFRYHFVMMNLLENPRITNRIISNMSHSFEFKMSESTVSRISNSVGFRSMLQQPREKLTKKQIDYRIKFAQEIPKSFYFLLPWCFSDESTIALEPNRKKVRVLPQIDYDEKFFEKPGYPVKIMVWACIGKNFKSKLIKINGHLKADGYQKMLSENKIFETLTDRFGPKGFVF